MSAMWPDNNAFAWLEKNIKQAATESGTIPADSSTIRTKDNRTIPVSFLISRVLDDNQKLAGFTLVLEDISTWQASYQALQQLEANSVQLLKNRTDELVKAQTRLYASINSLKQGFILLNQDLSVILLNSATLRLLKIDTNSPGTENGCSLSGCTLDDIERAFAGQLALRHECQRCLHDHKPFESSNVPFQSHTYQVNISPVVLENNTIGLVLLIGHVGEKSASKQYNKESIMPSTAANKQI